MKSKDIITIEDLFSVDVLQSIVEKTGSLVQHDIVICNREGAIVAATQRPRIGMLNEHIRDMIENESEVFIIEKRDDENDFKPGINLLIRYERMPIGSVGITGEPSEVKIFGKLIKAFVEQQILYNKSERDKVDRKHLINNFVYSWIFRGAGKDYDTFDLRGLSLGINVKLTRVVCIMRARKEYEFVDNQIQSFAEDYLRNIDKQNVTANFGNELVMLISHSEVSAVENIMKNLCSSIYERFERKYAMGIGCAALSPEEIKLSYEAAKIACRVSKNADRPIVFGYNMELLVASISADCKQSIYNHTFRNYKTDKQIEESVDVIENYISANRSLKRAAENSFMHENTVQQRLTKIHELTGYNPREAKDLSLLHAVTLLHRSGTRRTDA